MAHPQEHAHAVLALRFKHGAVGIVVHELGEPDPLLCIGRAAKAVFNDAAEAGATHSSLQAEIVEAPIERLWPKRFLGHHQAHAVERGNIGRTDFAVQFFIGYCEVELCRVRPIGAVSADHLVSRTWDVVKAGMHVTEDFANPLLERRGREALVAAAVETYGRMIPDAQDKVVHVLQEELIVVWFRAVPRIGQPEVLPNHNPMAIAGFVKCVIADLADPVANHGEIHLTVIAHGGIVFARTIAQHRFAESHITPARDESAANDPDAQISAVFAVGHLANTGLEGSLVDYLSTGLYRDLCNIEIRITVADRPPQPGILHVEGRNRGRIQRNSLHVFGGAVYALLNLDVVAQLEVKCAAEGTSLMVDDVGLQRQVRGRCIGKRKLGGDKVVFDCDCFSNREKYVSPDTNVTAAHGRDPLASNTCVIGRIVGTESAAVLGADFKCLLLGATRRGIFLNTDCECVHATGQKFLRYVELAAHEAAFNPAQFLTVQKHFCLPINSVEVEPCELVSSFLRSRELRAIPEIRVEIGIGNVELVLAEVRIRNRTDVRVRGQYRAGHRSHQPVCIVEGGLRQCLTRIPDEVCSLYAPCAASNKLFAICA